MNKNFNFNQMQYNDNILNRFRNKINNVSQKVIYDIKYHNTHKDVLKQS